jgi:multiple sugar transport system substrate-binding protein
MKRLLSVVLTFALVLLLAPAAFSTGTKEAGTAGQKAELTFWGVHTEGPESGLAMQQMVDQFNSTHPDIVVKYQQVTGSVVYPKFLTAARGGDMPDVADGYAFHPLQFAAMDQMLPLDDVIAEWQKSGRINELTNPIAYKTFLWNGHYWAVPWALDIRCIYYRSDWLKAAGITPPTDWGSFQQAAVKMNQPDKNIFGLSMPAGDFWITQHYLHMFMVQNGGTIIDDKGKLAFGSSSKAANVGALKYMTDFYTKYHVTPPGIASYNTDEEETIFVQEKAAFLLGRGGTETRFLTERPDLIDKIGVLDTLQGPVAKLTTGFYNPLFIWKGTKYPEAAKKFLKYIAAPGVMKPLYEARPGQQWSVWKPDFTMEVWNKAPQMKEMNTKVIPYVVPFNYPSGAVPQMGVIDGEKMTAKPVNAVIAGGLTPEQAIDEAQAAMAKLWK